MRNQWHVFIGILIILVGLVFLVGTILDVDVGALCLPIGLIALGVFMLLRPHLISPDTAMRLRLLGGVRRHGAWQVTDEEIWIGVGDVRLDMSNADIPVGETQIRVFGFVGDVRLRVPEGVGVSVSSIAFVMDARVLGQKRSRFFAPLHLTSEDYETAERKINLEANYFVGDVRVRRARMEANVERG
ncbi:MAG: cell wall-active antibiotics response protein [Chloroflexi bacterium]|jgi:lia operon protein LiaF|nr:cell wall-active antibiotics response protein [Chloroflexota bacterium]